MILPESPITNEADTQDENESWELRPRSEEEQRIADVVEEMVDYYVCNHYPSRFEILKAKFLFNEDEKSMIVSNFGEDAKNLTCHRHGLIDSVHDTFEKELLSQNYTPEMLPMHPCKRDVSDDAQDAYDWMYHRSGFENHVSEKIIQEASLIGDSYAFFGKQKSRDYEVPTAEHVSFFEMFIEPMATDFYQSRYKIVRKIMHSVDVIHKYEKYTDWNDTGAFIENMSNKEAISETIDAALYKTDFTKIRDVDTWGCNYKEACDKVCNGVDGGDRAKIMKNWFETGACYEDLFSVDMESGLCEVIEVRTKKEDGHHVTVMINGYILPSKKKGGVVINRCPFGNVYFEENIGSPIHRGIGHKIMPRQRQCDLYQFIIDNGLKMHAFPDWIAESGLLDANGELVQNLTWSGKQRVVKTNQKNIQSKQPFRSIEYIQENIINTARMRLQEVESTALRDVGMNSYLMGGDGKVERVRAAHDDRMNQSRARQKTIKKSIGEALNVSFYVWIEILDGKFAVKLLRRLDDDNKPHLVDLDISEISNNFEVLISSEGHRKDTLDALGQNVLNVLSGLGEAMQDEFGITYNKGEVACALANNHGLDVLRELTPDERVKKDRETKELGLRMMEQEFEFAEKAAALKAKYAAQQPEGGAVTETPPQGGAPLPPAGDFVIETDEAGEVI